jgi:hypothetical protein
MEYGKYIDVPFVTENGVMSLRFDLSVPSSKPTAREFPFRSVGVPIHIPDECVAGVMKDIDADEERMIAEVQEKMWPESWFSSGQAISVQDNLNREMKKARDLYCGRTWMAGGGTMQQGDRVRIREGYFNGDIGIEYYFYVGKNPEEAEFVLVSNSPDGEPDRLLLADAIEPYPYSVHELLIFCAEDYLELREWSVVYDAEAERDSMPLDEIALLFAILDTGIL